MYGYVTPRGKKASKEEDQRKKVMLKGQLLVGMPTPTKCQKLGCGSFAMLAKMTWSKHIDVMSCYAQWDG